MAEAQEKRMHLDTRLAAAFGRDVFVQERGGPGHHEATLMARDLAALLDKLDQARVNTFELQRIMGDRDRACDLVTSHREAWQRLRQAVERIIPGFVAKPGEHAAEQAVRALEELSRLRSASRAALRDVKRRLREASDQTRSQSQGPRAVWVDTATHPDGERHRMSLWIGGRQYFGVWRRTMEEALADLQDFRGTVVDETAETEQDLSTENPFSIERVEVVLSTLGFDPQTLKAVVEVSLTGSRESFRGILYVNGELSAAERSTGTFREAAWDAYRLTESWAISEAYSHGIPKKAADTERDVVAGDPHPPRTATNLGAAIEIEPGSPDRIGQVYTLLSKLGERLGRLEARLG